MYTSIVKSIISFKHPYNNGSSIHGCFLDASKVFDLVDHSLLFQKLIIVIYLFQLFIYCHSGRHTSQKMKVLWERFSSFCVSNSVILFVCVSFAPILVCSLLIIIRVY